MILYPPKDFFCEGESELDRYGDILWIKFQYGGVLFVENLVFNILNQY